NLDDAGRVDGPHALDADAVGDLADRERAAGAASLAVDADALENLDAILASLGDPRVDADGISWAEDGDVAPRVRGLDRFNQRVAVAHGGARYLSSARAAAARRLRPEGSCRRTAWRTGWGPEDSGIAGVSAS